MNNITINVIANVIVTVLLIRTYYDILSLLQTLVEESVLHALRVNMCSNHLHTKFHVPTPIYAFCVNIFCSFSVPYLTRVAPVMCALCVNVFRICPQTIYCLLSSNNVCIMCNYLRSAYQISLTELQLCIICKRIYRSSPYQISLHSSNCVCIMCKRIYRLSPYQICA
jgi:hypothetical protein